VQPPQPVKVGDTVCVAVPLGVIVDVGGTVRVKVGLQPPQKVRVMEGVPVGVAVKVAVGVPVGVLVGVTVAE
jgi:hypothetical protein